MKKQWHQLSSEQVVAELNSDLEHGLSSTEVAKRLAQYGYNELQEKASEPLWKKFFNQFKDFLVVILIVASLISLSVGEVTDSLVIITIVLLNAALGVFQEAKAEKALEALKKMNAPSSKVIRNGKTATIPSRELLPGDIILLDAGDYIPADVRILDSFNLRIEEASLTGESVPVEKDCSPIEGEPPLADRHNLGFMSTVVTYGRGKAIAVGTAMNTEIGKIAKMIQTGEEDTTPLQKKLAEFGKGLGVACLAVCAIIFAMGLWKGYQDGTLTFNEVQMMLMTSISLAVAAIPEGLPAVVTIVLALGMQRMARKNSIMKRLHAVETLGSISVICSDKTGTLTQNQMTVVKIFTPGKLFAVSGEGYSPVGQFTHNKVAIDVTTEKDLAVLLRGSILCNDAQLKSSEDKSWSIIGDPTEGALVVAGYKGGYTQPQLTEQFPRLQEIPFDSGRKMMTTLHQIDGQLRTFTKGAPDVLLSCCTAIAENGVIRPLNAEDKAAIQAANRDMASHALRVLAIAYRDFDINPDMTTPGNIENELVFIGLLGMIDPPRMEVKDAVELCRSAVIRPVMITGDHPDTAFAIAKQLGIATSNSQVRTGKELDSMSPDDLKKAVETASVFARVSPEHKVAIVETLRSNKHIVAMTGDGVNDAPALKKADIGVAMGITGTDVTKETADMVISDDNFATIVSAVEEGRVIYTNIKKFVFFLLACNVSEILVIFFAMLFGWAIPLLPIQLLWVNLVTDAFPALALGVEKKEPNVMNLKPRDPAAPLMDRNLKIMILVQSMAIAFTVLGAFQYALTEYNGDLAMARTFAFTTLITTQIACAFVARSEYYSAFSLGFFSNKYLNAGVGLSFVLLLLSVEGPLHVIFKTVEPGLHEWPFLIAAAVIPFFITECAKWLLNFSFKPSQSAKA
ncbi:Calcium-transporting ATPase 1 [Sporomusa ovata DSM 2662]|uniref:P-type Ca(2+) transporter n=1 Tax=Sporomusa ovata TaxID=2378 RepID=A0A0U1L136_9FIRM|nr:cation-translocating P-type ATPase [Sporomusa ovata]EQB27542.1 calcium-transporting ATPase [Sporomusa ovata DSM 2662]CQR73386.1 Lead, cadmium, zinc and mercury transporting ATPase; Copper-translocating P-type ATPase [Sporomusa ovata]